MSDDLNQFRTLAKNWEALALADPMFGVLSDPTKQHGQWDAAEFFASGAAHIDKVFRILAEHGVTFEHGAALDFGCGLGRLTLPLSRHFQRTVGIDVSKSMIAGARRHGQADPSVEFIWNPHPDLRLLPSATFDFIYTSLVLQHIPPNVSASYIAEFCRVAKPRGLVVFQLPSRTISEDELTARYKLPDSGYRASFTIRELPATIAARDKATVTVSVRNDSDVTWDHDIPAGRHICLANHWRHADGSMLVPDDGRARLPRPLAPGESIDIAIVVEAPDAPGPCVLEVDLVQERVCWFAERGSPTGHAATTVAPSHAPAVAPPPPPAPARIGLWQRLRRRWQGGQPTFEMHVIPRAEVEQIIQRHGSELLHAIDDGAAGDRWESFTYVARRKNS